MKKELTISVGMYSDKGQKPINQDFHDIRIPLNPLLTTKGIAVALADGISSSQVSQEASKVAVTSFLSDYFSTPETWPVSKSAQRVLKATNSWLYTQTRQSKHRYDMNKGYVCTFSGMVIRSATAHLFHVGDARIYRLRGTSLEQLTEDHRLWVSQEKSYLSRALGMDSQLSIDYDAVPIEAGDVFMLMTDGVYETLSAETMVQMVTLSQDNLEKAAETIVAKAFELGSDDNLTLQIVRVDSLPDKEVSEIQKQLKEKPFPPLLEARMEFDGYKIVRTLSSNSRSHVFLAVDLENEDMVVLKTPSVDLRNDKAYLERFVMEEWNRPAR